MGEGVERRTGERLALLGIETAWQLREAVRQHASRAEGRNFAARTV
jgi:nucleotidyltransferase/DNA polymerase involved in DNA repair